LDPNSPLHVFFTVVEERSFTRAAEKLYRTQPAVSLAVQRLEQELGAVLLDRSGRELALTEAGKLVHDWARRAGNLRREVVSRLGELHDLSIGRLVLGASDTMVLYLLPHLKRFRRRYPRIRQVVSRTRSAELPERLLAGDVDFGVLGYALDEGTFEALPIYNERLAFVVPPDHRLARRRSVALKELEVESFVAHNVPSPYREQVISEFRRRQLRLTMDIEMPTLESIRLLVQAGEGVAFLPRLCLADDLERGLLKEVKVRDFRLERQIYLVRVARRPVSQTGKAFLEVVRGAVEKR